MFNLLKSLLPDTSILSNFRLPLEEKKLEKERGLPFYELDVPTIIAYLANFFSKVFLPNLSLAFEYQGETHYFSSHIFGRASNRQKSDNIKQKFITQMGITLISIPFWWDKSRNSLASTIKLHRPDIEMLDHSTSTPPIPLTMPSKLHRQKYIPNCSKDYNGQIDPTGW
jgi:hypothetical protein